MGHILASSLALVGASLVHHNNPLERKMAGKLALVVGVVVYNKLGRMMVCMLAWQEPSFGDHNNLVVRRMVDKLELEVYNN